MLPVLAKLCFAEAMRLTPEWAVGGFAAPPAGCVLHVDNLVGERAMGNHVARRAVGVVFGDGAEVVRVLLGNDIERRADLLARKFMPSVALAGTGTILLEDDGRSLPFEYLGGVCAQR